MNGGLKRKLRVRRRRVPPKASHPVAGVDDPVFYDCDDLMFHDCESEDEEDCPNELVWSSDEEEEPGKKIRDSSDPDGSESGSEFELEDFEDPESLAVRAAREAYARMTEAMKKATMPMMMMARQ